VWSGTEREGEQGRAEQSKERQADKTDRQAINSAINPAIANGESSKRIRHTEESDENGREEKMGKSYRHTIE